MPPFFSHFVSFMHSIFSSSAGRFDPYCIFDFTDQASNNRSKGMRPVASFFLCPPSSLPIYIPSIPSPVAQAQAPPSLASPIKIHTNSHTKSQAPSRSPLAYV
ncbi:hypothetical protein FB451DRAFT_1414978 [Mycena latifolia]|nr:hypothetical protein FB451DRAFT_1414978 [Mycena latifolia]